MKQLVAAFVALFITISIHAQNLISGTNPNFNIPSVQAQGDETDYGYNNMVIARWVTPQFQTINRPTKVGLLAYHFSDINHVQFYLNGGPVTKVWSKSWNDGIFGYWIEIPAIPDSQYNRLVAVVVPNSGMPFVLQGDPRYNPNFLPGGVDAYGNQFSPTRIDGIESLQFASDFNGTLRKVNVYVDSTNGSNNNSGLAPNQARKTVFSAILAARDAGNNVDGAIVNFLPGDYKFGDSYYVGSGYPRNFYRPVVFQPYGNSSVRLTEGSGSGALAINSYHIKNMTITPSAQGVAVNLISSFGVAQYAAPVTYIGSQPPTDAEYSNAGKFTYAIVENCFMDNLIETTPFMFFFGFNGNTAYRSRVDYIGCHVQNVWNAFTNGDIVKNCTAYNVHSDMVDGGSCVVGLRFERFGKYVATDAHPDLMQWYRSPANTVMYNVKCVDEIFAETCATQGIFNNPAGGGVVLNVAIDGLKWQGWYVRQLSIGSSHNVMIRNSNIGGSWNDGCKVIPQFDTGENFLLQGVTRNTLNVINGTISSLGSPVYSHHNAAWTAAGSPRRGLWEYDGTRYQFTYRDSSEEEIKPTAKQTAID